MENLIEKMLSTEFERLTTAELNRPLQDNVLVTEEDRLTAVISGMLRQRRYNFIELFKGIFNQIAFLLKNYASYLILL
jgi:vacuolar protein sorting-associated protein 54